MKRIAKGFATCALVVLILGEFAYISNAATGWIAKTYTGAILREQFHPVTVGYDGESGDAVPVGPSNPLPVTGTVGLPSGAATSAKQDTGNTSLSNLEAYVQCIRPAANTKSVTATATTSTAVDAGCSGNALYTQISNLDRTVDVVVTTPDGGSFNLGPLRTSPKVCKTGSATPDNFTVTSVDGSSIVSVVAGCAS